MDKKSLDNYETSFLILTILIIGQLFLIFATIYYNQSFTIESFTIVVIQLIAILLSYFFGLVTATFFSIVYIVGYVFYAVNSEGSINFSLYILLFFIPLSTILAGNMNRARKNMINDLMKLDELENMNLKIDPHTHLSNEIAFKEILSRNTKLANRYDYYFFSVTMFRLEFIDTVKTLLGVQEFNDLLKDIATVIQSTIRDEDYKFIVSRDRFVIIAPLSLSKDIGSGVRRIFEGVDKLDIIDRNGENVSITLKKGTLDFTKENCNMFEDPNKLLLELQKSTEVDIYGEYDN